MTKKILSLAAGLLLSASAVHAEQFDDAPKSEISVSYGVVPLYYIGDSFANVIGSALGTAIVGPLGGEGTISNKSNYGVINIDYNYHLCPWFALGINADWSRSQGDINITHLEEQGGSSTYKFVEGQKIGTSKADYYTFMLNVKFDWFRREHLSMYSRLSGGVLIANTSESRDKFGSYEAMKKSETSYVFEAQISPFGIEAGGNNIRAFAEVGIGQCGIAQIGCRFRF